MKISEQSLQNSEGQFLPGNSKANKVTNLSRGLNKGIFGPAKTQKPHLLRKKIYLKKLLEDIIPQNGGKLKTNERKKEDRHEIPSQGNQNQERITGIHKPMPTAMKQA